MTSSRPGVARLPVIAVAGAAVWSLGLLALAFLPTYSTSTVSEGGEVTYGTETLVGENGGQVLVVLAIPLAATLAVGLALLLRRRRGSSTAAWVITALFGVFNLLAMLSVGVLLLPVTAALVTACVASRDAGGDGVARSAPTTTWS